MNKDFIRKKTAESINVYRAPIKLLRSDKIVKPNLTLKKNYCSMFN
jgi:DNA-binding XRE family transcriptional regulator